MARRNSNRSPRVAPRSEWGREEPNAHPPRDYRTTITAEWEERLNREMEEFPSAIADEWEPASSTLVWLL